MRKILSGLAVMLWGIVLVQSAKSAENISGKPSSSPHKEYDATYSVCQAVVPVKHKDFSLANTLYPLAAISEQSEPSKITLVEKPDHGSLVPYAKFPDSVFVYHPKDDYLGPDQMTFVVEVQGKSIKVTETVWVANVAPEYGGCPADYKLPPAK